MRYIKLFERFDEDEWASIEQNIKDIFVELIDIGYVIEVKDAVYDSVSVCIKKPKELDIEDTRDYILMFIDYMSELWSDCYITTSYEYELDVFTKKLNHHNRRIKSSRKLDFTQWNNEQKPIGWMSSEIVGITCFVTKINFK
jgi:uncharacterized protein (UPF0335 family)